uniref:Zinc finger, CCHC domain containing 2 n=1 Tax=Periophthalmus magnuspinnatus TaxID=409849 RepID=A0A3B4ALT0_9GOBI
MKLLSHGPGQLPLNKETVFEWFGLHLDPVRRLEFMCGLLHMCQPLELRFLGSYLEDLARKDYHILRDFECRANSPSELGNLTDVNDPVVRSKLLVCLSLLGSDSRECAGILFQTLSRVDPALLSQTSFPCPGGGEAPVDGSSEQNQAAVAALEQLALLFTMASLHPAFHFHQRQMLRAQLEKTQLMVEEEQRQSLLRRTAQCNLLYAIYSAPWSPVTFQAWSWGSKDASTTSDGRPWLYGGIREGRPYHYIWSNTHQPTPSRNLCHATTGSEVQISIPCSRRCTPISLCPTNSFAHAHQSYQCYVHQPAFLICQSSASFAMS